MIVSNIIIIIIISCCGHVLLNAHVSSFNLRKKCIKRVL